MNLDRKKLKDMRVSMELAQGEVASAADLWVSVVSGVESGQLTLTPKMAQRIESAILQAAADKVATIRTNLEKYVEDNILEAKVV